MEGNTLDIYRAWSSDWNTSITFTSDVNRNLVKFKKHLSKMLGENWGWELCVVYSKLKGDLAHYTSF